MIKYERRVKKDREKEKKKYISPMPINNVNIKLDDKFMHRNKEVKVPRSDILSFTETQFKIHSMFNTTTERKKGKEDGNRTASNGTREEHNDEKFRMTDQSNQFANNSYSIELKQKI